MRYPAIWGLFLLSLTSAINAAETYSAIEQTSAATLQAERGPRAAPGPSAGPDVPAEDAFALQLSTEESLLTPNGYFETSDDIQQSFASEAAGFDANGRHVSPGSHSH